MKVLIAVLTLSLAGCASKVGSSNSENKEYNDSYQFEISGCDTKLQTFSSSSPEETRKQLCTALKDDKLNGGCAEVLRHELFVKKCAGYVWSEQEAPVQSEEIESMIGHNESTTWVTLTKATGIGDFCTKVKLPEEQPGFTSFTSSDEEGVIIVCDTDSGAAKFMFCTGRDCGLTETKVTLRSSTVENGLRKLDYGIVLKGNGAKVLFTAMANIEKQQFKSSDADQTRVKLKCTAESCAFDVLIYTK